MERNALISIIVPIYNVKPYLAQCVSSILNQKYSNFELILVDDGSTDGSSEICDKVAEKEPRVRVIHIENGGPSVARNRGMESARGEYIAFVDSDDFISEDYLMVLYENAVRFNSDVSQCGFVRFENEDGIHPYKENLPVSRNKEYLYNQLAEVDGAYESMKLIVVWNKLIRREIAEKISFPAGHWHEDEFYVNYLMENVETYIETPAQLYFYRKRPDSIVGEFNRDNRRHLDLIDALKERRALYRRVCNDELKHKIDLAYIKVFKTQCKTILKYKLCTFAEKIKKLKK